MAWIESHQELAGHPKTKKLARKLSITVPTVIGHLHLLWWWAMDYAQEGDLTQYESEDIADAMMWEGSPDDLLAALIESGFLEDENGLIIHDWHDYAGRLMEQRKHKNKVKARNKALYDDRELTAAIRERDGNNCRYCGRVVDWKDRKSSKGATYDHVDPEGPNTVGNIVVSCRGCNSAKGRRTPEDAKMTLFAPGTTLESTGNLPDKVDKSIGNLPYLTEPNLTKPKEKDMPTDMGDTDDHSTDKKTGGAQSTTGKGQKTPAEKLGYTSEFEKFWSVYPRKIAKKRAYELWKRRTKKESPENLILAAENYAKECLKKGTELDYIKHPSTFLSDKLDYQDYLVTAEDQLPFEPEFEEIRPPWWDN